ncbi:hypothetical protein GOV04_03470 [Candidatus Woesearchaeota archaeon]|nr:hypothetical protein [Candidatus Woesearchaeota archaeon]
MKKKKSFCPSCGKPSIGLCKNCAPVELNISEFNIKVCASCNKYFYKNKWHATNDLKADIEKIIKKTAKSAKTVLDVSDLQLNPGIKKTVVAQVVIDGAEFDILVNFEVTLCPNCSKQNSDYFEAILQLRGSITKDVESFVLEAVEQNKSKGVFINKKNVLKDGVDYYLTNKKFCQNLAIKIQQNFGGVLKTASQIFSYDRQTSKHVYRLNVLVKLPSFKKSDVIVLNNMLLIVNSVDKKINGLNLQTTKKVSVDYDEKNTKLVYQQSTSVINNYPTIAVMHPKTFQPTPANNPKKLKLQINQKIMIVEYADELFIIK